MKVLTALIIAVTLSSTSALAFQEKPSPETGLQPQARKTTAISQFSDDDNDGAISKIYGQSLCSGAPEPNCGYSVSTSAKKH
jgi:hypothetical protein